MKTKSKLLLLSVISLWLLTGITGCVRQKAAFDHRDYVELPKGTVIKNVPFYLNGSGKPPVLADYTTGEEGAWYSVPAQKVLK